MGKYTNMTIEDVILRIREECDKLYEKYKGNSLIEEDDILDADKVIAWPIFVTMNIM